MRKLLIIITTFTFFGCINHDYESEIIESPSEQYYLKTTVNRTNKKNDDYAYVIIHVYDSNDSKIGSINTRAGDFNKWNVDWADTGDKIILQSSDIGHKSWTITDNVITEIKPIELISCTSSFVMEDGEHADGYYNDYDNFIKEYFSIIYTKDTIIASTLIEINSCAETIGAISTSNDTIYLKTKRIGDEACASVIFEKFNYRIYNPENKKYIIISER